MAFYNPCLWHTNAEERNTKALGLTEVGWGGNRDAPRVCVEDRSRATSLGAPGCDADRHRPSDTFRPSVEAVGIADHEAVLSPAKHGLILSHPRLLSLAPKPRQEEKPPKPLTFTPHT